VVITAKPNRAVDFDTFADLTPTAVVADGIQWVADGMLAVEFASNLTPTEVLAVKARMESRNANEEILRLQAYTALQANRDFRALPQPPSNAAVLAEVRSLAQQNNGIIRMLLGQLDGTD
jgi:hypothetical protein